MWSSPPIPVRRPHGRKGFRWVKKQVSSKEPGKIKAGRKERPGNRSMSVQLLACFFLLSTCCVQGTVRGFTEEIMMGQLQLSVRGLYL